MEFLKRINLVEILASVALGALVILAVSQSLESLI